MPEVRRNAHETSVRTAGIEILDAAQRVHNPETLKQILFEKVPAREIKNQVAAG